MHRTTVAADVFSERVDVTEADEIRVGFRPSEDPVNHLPNLVLRGFTVFNVP